MHICFAELCDFKDILEIKNKLSMVQSAMTNLVLKYSAKYCRPCLDPELLKSWKLYHCLQSLWDKGQKRGWSIN